MPRYVFSIYSLITLAGALVALACSAVLSRMRQDACARWLAWLTLLVGYWGVGSGFEYAATDLTTTVLWAKLSYLGIGLSPVLFVIFSLSYGRQRDDFGRYLPYLSILPLVTWGMALTNDYHHLLWSSTIFDPATNLCAYGHGAWFLIFVIYTYTMIAVSIISLLSRAWQTASFYLSQSIAVLVAAIIPIAANIAYLTHLTPVINTDWTPTSFSLMGVMLALSMRRFRLFDLQPVIRSRLLETMQEAVLFVDQRGRVADYNRAMVLLLPGIEQRVGQPCADLFPRRRELADALGVQGAVMQQVWLTVRGEERIFEMRVRPLIHKRTCRSRGHLAVLYDITEEHRLAAERDGLLADLRGAMEKVQELGKLLPICANCKKIRDDQGYWHSLDAYLRDHSEAEIALATCPDCRAKLSRQGGLEDLPQDVTGGAASSTNMTGGLPLVQPTTNAD